MKISPLEQKALMNIQLGVIFEDLAVTHLHVIDAHMYVRMICFHRNVKDADIQTLERRLMQTMDMIISKKKRSVL